MIPSILLSVMTLMAAPALPQSSGKSPLVAVMPLEARQVSPDEALILSEALAAELQGSGEVRVMERSQMDKILAEQGFQKSGACSGTECAVEVGQLLGIDRMVVGSVGKLGKTFVLVARMVDVASGEVLRSSTRQAPGEIDEILTSLVPQVGGDLLGRAGSGYPPPEVKFSSPVSPDLWSDSVVIAWQATSRRGLVEARAQIHRPDRPDSAITTVTRQVKGTMANGDMLLIFPAKLDTGAYVLRLSAKDATGLSSTADMPVRRHSRIEPPKSHWGVWLTGGILLVGAGGAAAWYVTQKEQETSSTPPTDRSLVVKWTGSP